MAKSKKKFSRRLAQARDYSQWKKLKRGKKRQRSLGILDDLAAEAQNLQDAGQKAQVGAMVGELEKRRGRFKKAVEYFRKSSDELAGISTKESKRWFRAALGEVDSLNKNVEISGLDGSLQRARKHLSRAKFSEQNYQIGLQKKVKKGGKILVDEKPVRASVAATKLGKSFLRHGRIDEAREFFQEALNVSPQGATRAHQGLAKIALMADENGKAEQLARQSLENGKYQAKTLGALELYVEARQKQGKKGLEASVISGLKNIKVRPVRTRAVLTLTKILRRYNDPAWQEISSWQLGGRGGKVAREMRKIRLAEAKRQGKSFNEISQNALAVLNHKNTKPSEIVAAAKDWAYSAATASGNKNSSLNGLNGVLQKASKWGIRILQRTRHSIALGAMQAENYDAARDLLNQNLTELNSWSKQWGRSLWALARMEHALKNYQTAAEKYLQFSGGKGTPVGLKVKGLRKWAEALGHSGEEVDGSDLADQVETALAGINDYQILLDSGRQISLLKGSVYDELKQKIYGLAESAALAAFAETEHPSKALKILLHLARKQYYDFIQSDKVTQNFTKLTQVQKDWLRGVGGSNWWEYLSLVFESFIKNHQGSQAENLAASVVNAVDSPNLAHTYVGTVFANYKLRSGDKTAAFEHFSWLVDEQPTHTMTAWAYYWQMLREYKLSNKVKANERATRLRSCFAGRPSLLWHWNLDCAAALIQTNFDLNAIDPAAKKLYDKDFLDRVKSQTGQDLKFV